MPASLLLQRLPGIGKGLDGVVPGGHPAADHPVGGRPRRIGGPPYVEDAGELTDQVPRAGPASAVLDIVEVLRVYRSTALFLHDAPCELPLAEPQRLAGLRNRLAEGHPDDGHGGPISSSPCQSVCSRICQFSLTIHQGINREKGHALGELLNVTKAG